VEREHRSIWDSCGKVSTRGALKDSTKLISLRGRLMDAHSLCFRCNWDLGHAETHCPNYINM